MPLRDANERDGKKRGIFGALLGPGVVTPSVLTCHEQSKTVRRTVRRLSTSRGTTNALIESIRSLEKDVFADTQRYHRFVNQVLRELHDHYKSTYWSYAERLATLTDILGEFHVSSDWNFPKKYNANPKVKIKPVVPN